MSDQQRPDIPMTETQMIKAEQRRVKENNAKLAKELADGPKATIEFQNHEDPPGQGKPSPPVVFYFHNHRYEVKHGDRVELPIPVIDHLNSLTVPVYENKIDPVTKVIRSVQATTRRRFSCLPVNMTDFSPHKPKTEAQASDPFGA